MYYSTESVLKHTIIHECSFIVETSCTDHSWYLTVYTIIHRCGFIADTSYFLRSQYRAAAVHVTETRSGYWLCTVCDIIMQLSMYICDEVSKVILSQFLFFLLSVYNYG